MRRHHRLSVLRKTLLHAVVFGVVIPARSFGRNEAGMCLREGVGAPAFQRLCCLAARGSAPARDRPAGAPFLFSRRGCRAVRQLRPFLLSCLTLRGQLLPVIRDGSRPPRGLPLLVLLPRTGAA